MGIVLGGIALVSLTITIVVLFWVLNDAKSRGVENPALWALLIFFTHWIGLIIYIVSRPPGMLIACEACGKKRLESSRRCPHCGER